MKQRYTMPVAVYIILLNSKNEILLMHRQNTGFSDGLWSLPSGHVENEESVKAAVIRETKEEINIDIANKDIEFKHVMHRKSDICTYIDFFFICKKWNGKPINNEPDKCKEIKWFKIDSLPKDIIMYVKEVIKDKEIGNLSIVGLD